MYSVNKRPNRRGNFLPGSLFRFAGRCAARSVRAAALVAGAARGLARAVRKWGRARKRGSVGPRLLRFRRAALPLAVTGALALAATAVVEESTADIDNNVFTSRADRLRLALPRGWRASEQPSYPGMLLWLARSQPPGQIVLAVEPFTRAMYCSWPPRCRAGSDAVGARYACALRPSLEAQRLRVGPVQAGPKDNETVGMPSIWFEYDDGRRFLRHAIAFSDDRAISLVLSAPSNEARAAHARAFEQALRTLRPLTDEETARATWIDAGPLPDDAAALAATTAAAPAEPAMGPCPPPGAQPRPAATASPPTAPARPLGPAASEPAPSLPPSPAPPPS